MFIRFCGTSAYISPHQRVRLLRGRKSTNSRRYLYMRLCSRVRRLCKNSICDPFISSKKQVSTDLRRGIPTHRRCALRVCFTFINEGGFLFSPRTSEGQPRGAVPRAGLRDVSRKNLLTTCLGLPGKTLRIQSQRLNGILSGISQAPFNTSLLVFKEKDSKFAAAISCGVAGKPIGSRLR